MRGRDFFIFLGLSSLFLFTLPKYTWAVSNLLITQVQISGGTGSTTNDFIEIYNQADQEFDLKGCKLVKRTSSGSTDTNIKSWSGSYIIPSHKYLLWANTNYTTISVTPDFTSSESISDNNSIAIKCGTDETATIMDGLAWGQVTNTLGEGEPALSPEPNQVLDRKKLSNTTRQDTDNNSADFQISSPNPHNSTFTPTETTETITQVKEIINTIYVPTPILPSVNIGDVVINELVSDPVAGEKEWIELYNKTNQTIDLSDFIIEDASGNKMPLTGTIAPDDLNKFFIINNLKISLNNDSETIILKYSDKEIDRVTYNKSQTGNNAIAADKSYSLGRYPDGQDTNIDSNDFVIMTPSLGKINSTPTNPTPQIEVSTIIIINELFPNPELSDDNEFIELFNTTANDIDLNGWFVQDNLTTYQINNTDFPNTTIPAAGYFVLSKNITRISLDNQTKEEVIIMMPDKKQIFKLSYPTPAPEGQSYSKDTDNNYVWTLTPTPNKINVINPPNLAPKILWVIPEEGDTNELLVFDASDSADPEHETITYTWNFGDDALSLLSTPSHAYANTGTYNIQLTISDSYGNTSKKSGKIKITGTQESVDIPIPKVKGTTDTKITTTPTEIVTGIVTIPPGFVGKNTFYINSLDYPIQTTKMYDFIQSGQNISLSGTTKDYSNGPKFLVTKNDSVTNLGIGKIDNATEIELADINQGLDNSLIKISGTIDKITNKSITIKQNDSQLKITSLNPIKNLTKGQSIQATGFIKYNNDSPILYLTDEKNISIKDVPQEIKQETITVNQETPDKNYLYILIVSTILGIAFLFFKNNIKFLKNINKIKKLFHLE